VHVARTGEIRKAYNNYVGYPGRKNSWNNKALMGGDDLNASNHVEETERKMNYRRRKIRLEGNINMWILNKVPRC